MVYKNKNQQNLERALNLSDNSKPTVASLPTDPTVASLPTDPTVASLPETLNSYHRQKMYTENANKK
jgi:hypothetical protein